MGRRAGTADGSPETASLPGSFLVSRRSMVPREKVKLDERLARDRPAADGRLTDGKGTQAPESGGQRRVGGYQRRRL